MVRHGIGRPWEGLVRPVGATLLFVFTCFLTPPDLQAFWYGILSCLTFHGLARGISRKTGRRSSHHRVLLCHLGHPRVNTLGNNKASLLGLGAPGLTTRNKKLLVTKVPIHDIMAEPSPPDDRRTRQQTQTSCILNSNSFLPLVAMPFAPSSVLAPSSKARSLGNHVVPKSRALDRFWRHFGDSILRGECFQCTEGAQAWPSAPPNC